MGRTRRQDCVPTAVAGQHAQATSILLVDDDPALVRRLELLLGASGYGVWAAGSGSEAGALLAQRQPDLILLDLMLPDTDGLVLVSRFKALCPAPIIILSARAEQVDRVLGLKLGAEDFVAKPFDAEDLLARIESALHRAAPRPQPVARRLAATVSAR